MKDQSPASVNTAFHKADQEHPGIIKADRATTGLDILAQAADQVRREDSVSPILQNIVKLPKVDLKKPKPKRLSDSLPDNISSKETIRKMALASIKVARENAEKEVKAKEKYL